MCVYVFVCARANLILVYTQKCLLQKGFFCKWEVLFLYKSSDSSKNVPFVRMYRSIILTTIRPAHEQMWFMLSDPGSTAVWSTSSLDGGHWSVTDLVPVLVGKCREFPV